MEKWIWIGLLLFVAIVDLDATQTECNSVKALLFIDVNIDSEDEAGQLVTQMTQVAEELHSQLPSASKFKMVLFGKHMKTFASSLSFLDEVDIKSYDFAVSSILQEEIFTFFTVSKYTHTSSEIAFLLTANENIDYDIPYILQYRKKFTIVNFGNSRDRKFFGFASSAKHVFHILSSDTGTAIQDIINLTCKDSLMLCDRNQFNEPRSVKCQDCSNVCCTSGCSSTLVKSKSCIGYCPYFNPVPPVIPAPEEVSEQSRPTAAIDHKFSVGVIVAIVLSIILLSLITCIGIFLYKKVLKWSKSKCRPDDGETLEEIPLQPVQQLNPQRDTENFPVEETDQPETGVKQPLLDAGDSEERSGPLFDTGDSEERSGPLFDAGDSEERSGPLFDAGDSEERSGPLFDAGDSEERSGPLLDAGDSEERGGPDGRDNTQTDRGPHSQQLAHISINMKDIDATINAFMGEMLKVHE